MKISLDWLKKYIDLPEDPETISDVLTALGLEVESVTETEKVKGGLKGLVVGHVLTCSKHPEADKLSLTTVNVGQETPLAIVCGAPNVAAGQKVVVAVVGTELYAADGTSFKIKKSKIRGYASEGMICSEDEIALGNSHDGILVLKDTAVPGSEVAAYFNVQNDVMFEIGLTPNRADAASHYGVARDLSAKLGRPVKSIVPEAFKADDRSLPFEIEIQNPEACPRYTGITVSGVEVKESPEWLRALLKTIGLSPINNIVDATNYVLHGLGQPLHAFDADKIAGRKIVVKTVQAGQTFVTLDDKERSLADTDLMICDSEKPLCIAGVFGGLHSGISASTKNVFLESAYFSPDSIRNTATRHGLKTDASFRFERGTNPDMTAIGAQTAALLIKELAGGKISSDMVDVYPKAINPFRVPVKYKNIDRLIGKAIAKEETRQTLKRLEIGIEEETETAFVAVVPPYRVDVQREADIIEEILRVHGYDNIIVSEYLDSDFLASFPAIEPDKTKQDAAEILAANGCCEILCNSLTKPVYAEAFESLGAGNSVEIENKLSADLGVMRQTLLFGGLEAILHNINRKQHNLKLFELGKGYQKTAKGYQEREYLGIWLTGTKSEESWLRKNETVGYHDLAALAVKVLSKFGVRDFSVKTAQNEMMGEHAEILSKKGKTLGFLGKASAKALKLVGLKQEVWYAELDWEAVMKSSETNILFREISKFPEVRRDLSLVIDKSVSFRQIKEVAAKAERNLLKGMNVFDVYEGDKIEAGKKAYSVHFTLQDDDKTLDDKAIDKTMQRLMDVLEKELGAHIRK